MTINVLTNVGLEDHGLSAETVTTILANLLEDGNEVVASRTTLSEGGDWEPERIVIQELSCHCIGSLERSLEKLAEALGEEAIAYLATKIEFCEESAKRPLGTAPLDIEEGYIAYNPRFKGERYNFNVDYFTK